jgi:tetratricopeptide (TPR) repeat protein
MSTAQPEIFFSYAWGGEKEEYALALYEALQTEGYQVEMDRYEVAYRDRFTKFMERIGRGAFIIVVISDKYLRSPYCMFELLEIYRKSNSELGEMAAKIFPVVMGDAGIYTDEGILAYTKYWRQKTNDLRNGMTDEMDLVDTVDFGTKLKRYNEIASNMVNFAGWLQDTNVPPPEKLAENGFAMILAAISTATAQAALRPDNGLSHHLLTPPFLADLFLGREAELETIREKLFAGDNLLLLVNGTGGVGKTSLAARYYHTYADEYAHLAWVLSEKSIANALLLLAVPLGLRFDEQLDTAQRIALLLQTMANLPRPCLLVIDNANELDDLEANYAALRRCPNFHLLLTTRITAFAKATICPVGALPYPLAQQLFTEYYNGHQAADDALFEQVYNAVEGNTLIIELLAKNLDVLQATHTGYGLAQLVADLQQGVLQISQTKHVESTYHADALFKGDPLDIIAAMYDIGELAPAEKRLLSILAVLPAENIPFATLQSLLPATEGLGDTLHSLGRKGWIGHDQQAAAYKISPVVQEIARAKNADLLGDCGELIEGLIDKLESNDQHITGCKYTEAPNYLRLAESVVANFSLNSLIFDVLLERLGLCHQILGNLPKALHYYKLDVQLCEVLCKTNPTDENLKNGLATSYSRLGETYADMGNLPEALRFYTERSKLGQQLYDDFPDNVAFKNGLAISFEKLGQTYASMGNLTEALRFYTERSKLGQQLYDDFPDNVAFKNGLAISFSKLGQTYADMGNLTEALRFYTEQTALFQQLYDDFPDNVAFKNGLAISFEKLGQTYVDMGNLPEALRFYQLDTDLTRQLHDDFPDNVAFKNGLAISFSKLGQTYADMGNLTEALRFYSDYQLLMQQLYDDFPDNVAFKNGLAISYAKLGDFHQETDPTKAREYFAAAEKLWVELVAVAPEYSQFKKYLDLVRSRLAGL